VLESRDLDCLPVLCSLRCPPLAKVARQVIALWKIELPASLKDQIVEDEKRFASKLLYDEIPGFAKFNERSLEDDAEETEEPNKLVPVVSNARRFDSSSPGDLQAMVFALNSDDKYERKNASTEFQRLFHRHGATAFHPAYALPLLMSELSAPSFQEWSVAWFWSLLTEPILVRFFFFFFFFCSGF
jgi:hypothetical protein